MAGRPRLYTDHAEQMRVHRQRQRASTDLRAGRYVTALADLVTARQTFRCLYADPPWPYSNQASRGATGRHYATLSLAELAALPVPALAAPASHLYLWVTAPFLPDGLDLLRAWGFTYKSHLVWDKGAMGLGNYFRLQHELLLFGTRGTLKVQARNVRSVWPGKAEEHSQKPEAIRQQLMRLSPPPYLELFGRQRVPGWVVWGNQLTRPWYQETLFDATAD